VASINATGWNLVKKKGNAWDLFDTKAYDEVMRPISYALIGHNRYATKGKINNINAHPFEFEHVVGAHNGTIRGQWRLPDSTDFEVDSENIFHSIETMGLESTLAVLDGAYALTYWDKRTEELILLRNSERELSYCYSKDGSALFWASEPWMLHVALSRNNVKYGEVFDVAPCHIHRFTFPLKYQKDSQVSCSIQKFKEFIPPKPATTAYNSPYKAGGTKKLEDKTGKTDEVSKVKDLLGKRIQFIIDGVAYTTNRHAYISGTALEYEGVEVKLYPLPQSKLWKELIALSGDTIFEGDVASTVLSANQVTVNYQTVEEVEDTDEDTILGYENKYLTEQQYLEKTHKGCAWCASPAGLSQAQTIMWINHDTFVCEDCSTTDEVKEHLQG
tara:strand:- start:37428 stop:38591 length:1164 start_codon:yes stop_codon:yes gene_type:complete